MIWSLNHVYWCCAGAREHKQPNMLFILQDMNRRISNGLQVLALRNVNIHINSHICFSFYKILIEGSAINGLQVLSLRKSWHIWQVKFWLKKLFENKFLRSLHSLNMNTYRDRLKYLLWKISRKTCFRKFHIAVLICNRRVYQALQRNKRKNSQIHCTVLKLHRIKEKKVENIFH